MSYGDNISLDNIVLHSKPGQPRKKESELAPGSLRVRRCRDKKKLQQQRDVEVQLLHTPSKSNVTDDDPPKPVDTPIPLSSNGQPLTGTPLRQERVLPDQDVSSVGRPIRGALSMFQGCQIDTAAMDPATVQECLRMRLQYKRQMASDQADKHLAVQKQADSSVNEVYKEQQHEIDDTFNLLLSPAFKKLPMSSSQPPELPPIASSSPSQLPVSSSPPPKLPSPVNGPPDEDDEDLLLGSPLGIPSSADVVDADVDSDIEDAELFGFQFGQDENNAAATATPSSLFPTHHNPPGKDIPREDSNKKRKRQEPSSLHAIFGDKKPAPFVSLDNVDTSMFKNNNPNFPNWNNVNNSNVNPNLPNWNNVDVNTMDIDENMMDES